MDFIERFFEISPDHGDGSLEAIILVALLIVVFGFGVGYFHKRTSDK